MMLEAAVTAMPAPPPVGGHVTLGYTFCDNHFAVAANKVVVPKHDFFSLKSGQLLPNSYSLSPAPSRPDWSRSGYYADKSSKSWCLGVLFLEQVLL